MAVMLDYIDSRPNKTVMPTTMLAHYINAANHANTHGRYEEAINGCQQALKLAPNSPEAWYNMGVAYRGRGDHAHAIHALRKTARLTENNPDAQNSIGLEFIELAAYADAERCLKHALALAPHFAFAHSNLGKLRERQKQPDAAKASFLRAIELQPDLAPAYSNLGGILNAQKDHEAAEAACRKAIELDPAAAEAWTNLGAALSGLKHHEAAEAACRKAIDLDPAAAEAWGGLGVALAHQGQLDSAMGAHRQAVKLAPEDPNALTSLGFYLLLIGQYREGWPAYEHRWEISDSRATRPRTSLPQWRGETVTPNAGILLFTEQGIGDSLQFIRYIPLLQKIFTRIAIICPPTLHRLFKASFGDGVQIVDTRTAIDPHAFQWHCPLLSLPLAFNTALEDIPGREPYLFPSPAARAIKADALLRVGLVWRGNPNLAEDRWRSIPIADFSILLQRPVHWISLQKDPTPEEVAYLPEKATTLMAEVTDFADTAAIIATLDLVISVDSSVAHLAAAMGKPVWLLNRATSEWRWGWKKERSPWYPSMRIFNQEVSGVWGPVLEHVTAALDGHATQSM
jgi:tetratricopeptide (TPR) repeat protein